MTPNIKKLFSKKNMKSSLKWILGPIILGLLFTTLFTTVFSNFIPWFDNLPPNIIEVNPSGKSTVYSLDNISVKFTDNGMGVDWEKTKIEIEGRNEGLINGEVNNSENTLYFIPNETMKPDIYTITISPADKAGNYIETPFSSVFYLSQKPNFNFWVKLYEHEYFPGDKVGELNWTKDNKYYLFQLENKGFQSLQNFHVYLNFPYPVVGFRTDNLNNAQSCKLKFPEGREVISGGTPLRLPSCDLVLECINIPEDGAYAGQIFVDVNYKGPSWMCNNRTDYSGTYYWDEFGYTKKEDINGSLK